MASSRRPGIRIPRASGETQRHLRLRAAGHSPPRRSSPPRRRTRTPFRWLGELVGHHSSDAAQTGETPCPAFRREVYPLLAELCEHYTPTISPRPMHLAAWRRGCAVKWHTTPISTPPALVYPPETLGCNLRRRDASVVVYAGRVSAALKHERG
jgi:hypothetical protein